MAVGRRPLPPGIPANLPGRLAQRMIGPGAPQTIAEAAPAVPAPPIPGGQPPGVVPAPPPQQAGGAPGPQLPGQPPGTAKEDQGVSPEIAETLRELMRHKKSRQEIESIVRQTAGEARNTSALKISPAMRMKLAQGWNARISEAGRLLIDARETGPGASRASDEALLRIYWTTPQGVELEDIDAYADAVRTHLIIEQGIKDEDEVEDTTMRWCYPLRELQIKAGRRNDYRAQVEFVNQMLDLTQRWLKQYGELPQPDWKVIKATEAGKGDPESQSREEDSEALPPGRKR
jgi:hypothetical protein